MALVKIPARDWKVEINTGTSATPAWTAVGGLTSLGFGASKNDRDTTTFDSDGWLEHTVTSRSRTLTLSGYYLEDSAGVRDAGQEAVDTAGETIGASSLDEFRLTSPGGTIRSFSASANPSEVGGGNDDNTSWGAELTISGKITTT